MTWRVYLLGDLRVACGERSITHFESRKVAALIARMALQPHRLHAREELAALLWPDADTRSGLERLRHVLSSLRRQLGATDADAAGRFLEADRHGIRLQAAQVTCDAFDFAALAERGRHAEAVALYGGDLLPGFYDDWIQDERERLRALYEEARERATPTQLRGDAAPPPPTRRITKRERKAESATDDAPAAPNHGSATPARRVYLPSYLTAFFGRHGETENLIRLLQTRRLVTITGPGGCGKTRIATETGRALAGAGGDGAFETIVFTPLADCVEPSQIFDRIRAALRLPSDVGTNASLPLEQIAVATGDAPALFILDNMEQINVEGAGEAMETLLARLPQARCLVTSRRPLYVDGEQIAPLSQLSLAGQIVEGASDGGDAGGGETMPASLALFVDRARLVRPDFALTARNRDDLVAVCKLLEGLPLAIEIAAARVRAYPPAQMRRELGQADNRLSFTTRSEVQQRKNPRHGSLHAALAWSWRLLSLREQNFLADISFLRGETWTARLAASVTGEPGAHALLHNLADQSLVQRTGGASDEDENAPDERFSLLETVRAFASAALSDARRYELRRRYAVVVLRMEDEASDSGVGDTPSIYRDNETPPLSLENTPLAELLARGEEALRYAVEDNKTIEAFALCAALDDLWRRAAGPGALDLVRQTIALLSKDGDGSGDTDEGVTGGVSGPPSHLLQARVFYIGSWLAAIATDATEAEPMARRAQIVAGSDPAAHAFAQMARGGVAFARRDPVADVYPFLDAAVEGARATGQMRLLVEALQTRGQLAAYAEDYENAERDLREAEKTLETAFASPERRGAWANRIVYDRAYAAGEQGDSERAIVLYEQSLHGAQYGGDVRLEPLIRNNLGVCYVHLNRWDDGLRAFRSSIERAYALGDAFLLAFALWNIVRPLAHLGAGRTAAMTLAFAEKIWNERSGPLTPHEADRAQQWRKMARDREAGEPWRDGEDEALQARGAAQTLAEAVRLVLAA